jgi:DNA polymerase-3 subunit beta
MEVTVEKNNFLDALSKAQFIVEKRTNLPVLSHVMLTAQEQSLKLSATDLEIGFQGVLPAEVGSEGSVTVSAKKLYDIVRELSSDSIYVKEKDNSWVFISAGDVKYNIFGLPAEDFPGLPEYNDPVEVEIPASQLKRMIDCTLFSTSAEDGMYNTSGVYLEKIKEEGRKDILRMVSTDGHRLSLIDYEVNGSANLNFDPGIVISRKAISEIKRLADEGDIIRMGFSDTSGVVKAKDNILAIRLMEKKFPDYRRAIPGEIKVRLRMPRVVLLDMLRRISVISTDKYKGARLELTPGWIDIFSSNPELGDAQEKKAIDYDGPEFSIGLNPVYLIDVLKILEGETVELGFADSETGFLITSESEPEFMGMIMPMKLP